MKGEIYTLNFNDIRKVWEVIGKESIFAFSKTITRCHMEVIVQMLNLSYLQGYQDSISRMTTKVNDIIAVNELINELVNKTGGLNDKK